MAAPLGAEEIKKPTKRRVGGVMALRDDPRAWRVASVEELMVLAEAQEREAAARYEQLAVEMDRMGSRDTGSLFRRLAEMERGHAEAVADWGRETTGEIPPAARWDLPPDMAESGAVDLTQASPLLTPYRALEMAVRNEERAFSFLTYIAANAGDRAVRERAEALAMEELRHVTMLRSERRRAYHAERRDNAGLRRSEMEAAMVSDAALLAVAAHMLDRAAAIHDAIAGRLRREGATDAARVVAEIAAREEACSQEFAARSGADAGSGLSVGTDLPGIAEIGPQRLILEAMRPVEEMADTYLAVADRTRDEAVLAEAQRLGGMSVTHLAALREQFDAVAGRGI
jgi:rubrerythrin